MDQKILRSIKLTIFLFSILLYIPSLIAQLAVVSTIPINGATEVDTAGTISISFNAPLDTTARFPHPGDFYLNIYFYPDSLVGEPDSVIISSDLQTVNVHNLHLKENTTYFFIIANAVNQAGDSLSTPYTFLFSTASILPQNTISGTISHQDSDPVVGTLVFLFDANPFETEGVNAVNGNIVNSITGEYTIDYVAPGTYWPAAIKDFYIDEQLDIDFEDGSSLGLYDSNGDNQPDSIVVPPNQSAINITLTKMVSKTAHQAYSTIEPAALAWAADAVLILLRGDLKSDGYSLFWNYIFYSPSLTEYKAWFNMGNMVVESALTEPITDTLAVPQNWLDSDNVMTIAEEHGGSDFRGDYPNAEISASLGYLNFQDDDDQSGKVQSQIKLSDISQMVRQQISGTMKSLTALSSPAAWWIEYSSREYNEYYYLLIDAVSGEVLNEPTTASTAENKATQVAQNWAADAELWAISSASWTSMDSQGHSEWWLCIYFSSALDSFHIVAVWGQIAMDEGPFDQAPPDSSIVDPNFMDSDAAAAIAETAGGESYRQTNQDISIQASLGRWWYGSNPSLTIWKFTYYSSTSGSWEIEIDALTGELLTHIDSPEISQVPYQFQLQPNHPNPFNPGTTIYFTLPNTMKIQLIIYNTLGQKISTLVDGYKTAGQHAIYWKPVGLTSGIYVVLMKSHNYQAIRKIHYVK
jgi:hypothetical protein